MSKLFGTIAAAGSDQAGATAIAARFTTVTGGDDSVGVRLPGCLPGSEFFVYNQHATGGVKVYPASGDDINDGTTDAAIVIEGKTLAIFVGMDKATWAAVFTTNT